MRISLLTTTAMIAVMPSLAVADVTPGDVWANIEAANRALGASTSADLSEAGDTLTVSDLKLTWMLPMGFGRIDLDYGTFTLTDQGDGTVALGGPADQTVSMTFVVNGEGSATITMGYSVTDFSTIAAGTPGDIDYTYDIGETRISFEELLLDGDFAEEAGNAEIFGSMVFSAMSGTYRITEGDLVTLSTAGDIGSGAIEIDYTIGVEGEGTIRNRSSATLDAMNGKVNFVMPAEGVSLLSLAAALRDGMLMDYTFSGTNQDSEQVTLLDGSPIMTQATSVESTTGRFTFDENGFFFGGDAIGYELSLNQPLVMPLPIAAAMERVDMEMLVPMLAGEAAQDATLRMLIDGVTIDPELWALFDPGANLPRDPASLNVDMTASLKMLVDLLDFERMAGLEESGAMPAEIEALTITGLNLKAVGAEADVVGAVTFDNSDLASFDGFPAPTGTATVSLKGANGLLDTLTAMGLLTDEDVMGARMVLGGFFRPGANTDEVVSEFAVDGETGQVTANGMRLR